MKTNLNNNFGKFLLVIVTLILMGFIPAKYSSSFKKEKSKIENLTIYSPVVHITANNNKTEYKDSTLSKLNQEFLDSLTNNLLSKKYNLNNSLLSEFNINLFTELFKEVERSPKLLNDISAKEIFQKLNLKSESKYALMLVYNGQINPDYPPHYNIYSGLASNSVIVNPNTTPYSDMRILIFDTENESVVFYDMVSSSNFDPRVSSEVEQLAKKILKKIYYK
ncbi:hypothetical protein GYB57_11840 [bacterium]|nr:hypothetical protein [bacterium]